MNLFAFGEQPWPPTGSKQDVCRPRLSAMIDNMLAGLMRIAPDETNTTPSNFEIVRLAAPGAALDKREWIAGPQKGLAVIEAFDNVNPRIVQPFQRRFTSGTQENAYVNVMDVNDRACFAHIRQRGCAISE